MDPGGKEKISPEGSFILRTFKVRKPPWRKREFILPNGFVLVLDAPQTAEITISTNKGEFSFTVGELLDRGSLVRLQGQARADLVASPVTLADTEREDDFPRCSPSPGREGLYRLIEHKHFGPPTPINLTKLPKDEKGIPTDYSAFKPEGGGDRVMLTWFDGERWAKPIPVTDEGLDIWRPSVVVDGEGKVWVLWSQNIEGNRDILAGRFDPEKGSFSKIQRLTFDPGADIPCGGCEIRLGPDLDSLAGVEGR
ncbi:MAG TPA: hypothetical protein EYP65_04705 [Armatimonadetes bacterium]|nr:hypothetical protein [Armatimonadota bacterium]